MYIAPAEAFWLAVNVTTALLTVLGLWHAYVSRSAVRALNGSAPRLVAGGDIRREWLRLFVQGCFVAAVIPGLFVDREIRLWTEAGLNWTLILIMVAPVGILANSTLDAIDRTRLLRLARRMR